MAITTAVTINIGSCHPSEKLMRKCFSRRHLKYAHSNVKDCGSINLKGKTSVDPTYRLAN